MDVRRDDRQLTVQASLPGFAPDDVAVTISPDRTLTIKASCQTEAGGADDKFLLRERHSGTFARALRLPGDLDLDAAAVSLEHGVLTVTAPVAAAAQTRRLPIGADAVDTGNPAGGSNRRRRCRIGAVLGWRLSAEQTATWGGFTKPAPAFPGHAGGWC